jgi:hypothetical protein
VNQLEAQGDRGGEGREDEVRQREKDGEEKGKEYRPR